MFSMFITLNYAGVIVFIAPVLVIVLFCVLDLKGLQ